MFNKKGDVSYPIIFGPYTILLLLILILYGVLFFGFDLAESQALVISGQSYKDSIMLINLLKTEIEINSENITIADAINKLNELNKEPIKKEIEKILLTFSVPNQEKDEGTGFWFFEVKKESNIILEAGDKANLGKDYLKQQITLPLSNKQPIFVNLYLSCRSCEKEAIERLS